MAIEIEDLLKTSGQDNDGGLGVFCYYARHKDIKTWPAVVAAPATYKERVTADGDFVFETGACFKRFQNTLEKSSLESQGVGERDSRSAENLYNIQHPGNKESVIGWLEEMKNEDLVVVVVDVASNTKRILGSEHLPASFESFNVTSGMAVADEKRVIATIKSIGRIAPFYEGDLPLTPAE